MQFAGIHIEISGRAYCQWLKSNNKVYIGRETYMEERSYLVDSRGGKIVKYSGNSLIYLFLL